MKKTLLLFWIVFFSLNISADPIDENTALKVANNFYTVRLKKAVSNFTLAYKCSSQAKSTNKNAQLDEKIYYYVFNAGDNGFIIISGDDNTYPVLGYSSSSSFDENKRATNFVKWMENYKQQIRFVIENKIPASEEIKAEWNNILKGGHIDKNTKAVSALLTTKWSQSPYVNEQCPYDDDAGVGNGYHAVSGCPATAMAQIMKYWEYPTQGKGFHSYNHDKYGTLSANFASTTYDWASMPNEVNSANNAVATLMYHCGVGVEMNYGPLSSGSYVILAYTQSPEQCSEYAYKTYFDYDAETIEGLMRENYTDDAWKQMLKDDLDAGRPIQYAGFGQGGHTFVCDGYDGDYFHMNWGWGGYADGLFLLDALNPGSGGTGSGAGTYNNGQQAIFGLKPANPDDGGGGTTTGYDLNLYSNITANPSTISYGQSYTVSADIANLGDANFSGEVCAALFDEEYNFVEFIETQAGQAYDYGSYYSKTFSTIGMLSALPGDYFIGLFYKETGEDWIIIDKGSYTQLIPFTVENIDDIRLYDEMIVSTTDVTQNEAFSVTLDIANFRATDFSGSFSVDLYNMDGSWAAVVEQMDGMSLTTNTHYTSGQTFSTTGVDVEPGTYLLALMYYDTDLTDPDWALAGTGDYTNPIKVTVKTPALVADAYEDNNTEADAYDLSAGLKASSILTTGSNMHTGEDIDYYKLDLPTGYNYTVDARVHDSYNSGDGQTYTNDASWTYLYDGVWSDVYDDVMPNTFTVTNGGVLIFSVSPYFIGDKGTYLLDIQVTTDGVNALEKVDFSENIKIYPIPAKDYITVDVSEFQPKVKKLHFTNVGGQKLNMDFNSDEKIIKLPLSRLSSGFFILSIETDEGVVQKRVLIQK